MKDSKKREGKEGMRIEPYLMTLLARRFEAINKEMTNTLLRTARSAVLNVARDFSCAVTDKDARLVSVAEGLPVHTGTSHMIAEPVLELHGHELKPGDCYFNNSGYYGGTHLADFTLAAPVFYKNKLVFFTVNRAHQADCGHPVPTTYSYFAKDIYEEGPHLPCVKIQQDYKDVEDIIRILKTNIRASDVWYGDYLAQLGAVRIGERRIIELCDKYGLDTIMAFADEWQEYGKRRMIEAIRKLPKITVEGEDWHDPVPMIAEEGIPVRAKVSVDPDEGYITIDLRDNIDNVPGGLNSTEATATAMALAGVFNVLDPTLPHNEGANSRVKILMREGAVIGKPKFPAGVGASTTNLVDRLLSLIARILTEALGYPHGIAQGAAGMNGAPVISGTDWRRGNKVYVNQMIPLLLMGGGGHYGADGWVTFGIPVVSGMMTSGSIEVLEQLYPIKYDMCQAVTDSFGAGQWDGGPSMELAVGPRHDPTIVVSVSDTNKFPVKGVLGGEDSPLSRNQKFNIEKPEEKTDVPPFGVLVLQPNERLYIWKSGGGGYGEPLERDPELVRHRVREEWVSLEHARDVYGVLLDTKPEKYAVDYEGTKKLREQLKKKKGEKK